MVRGGVVRVSCSGGLRSLVVGDLVRRVVARHRLRTIGIWDDVPGASDLNVRPAELTTAEPTAGEPEVNIGATVGRCPTITHDGHDPLAVRLLLLSRHYRSDVDLADGGVAEAQESLTAWRRLVAGWAGSPGRPAERAYVEEALAALDDDLDTPAVFGLFSRLAGDEGVPPGARFETAVELDMMLGLDLVRLVGHL